MCGLCRQPLVAGAGHGSAVSSTGIPEGDPLSILGMFALCCLFRAVVGRQEPLAIPFSYADNWEVVVGNVQSLAGFVQALDRMTTVCLLPVAPSKCWTWAFNAADRKVLREVTLAGQRVPVKVSGCCLGADMAYSYRIAAAKRNDRVSSGHKRLLRLRGIPTSRFRKCHLILGGVYPHALHACEATWIPATTLVRLRSKVVKSLKFDGAGVNPLLVCAVAAPKVLDPEFLTLLSRVRLFRQLWRDFPDYQPILLARLSSAPVRFKTPTDHFVRALAALGWFVKEEVWFVDSYGRRFSLVSTSLSQIRALLLRDWGQYVGRAVSHRKGLAQVESVDLEFSRPSKSLLPSERGLLCQLVRGRHFTMDARSKFAGSAVEEVCPHCGTCKDSREHRVFTCTAFHDLRQHYQAIFDHAPKSALLFGLWPQPDGLLEWPASLDAVPLLCPERSGSDGKTCFFSDGSCLFPSVSDIRVAAAAVVTPSGAGTYSKVWSGILPTSQQSIQRAELLAGTIATGSALHPVVISDSLYFVRTACRLHQDWCDKREPKLPAENSDLWEFISIKAHQVSTGCQGLDKTMIDGNNAADALAKQEVRRHQRTSKLYQRVVSSRLLQVRLRGLLDAYHLHLKGSCDTWFCALEWFQGCSPGEVTDISWVELFLFWIVDTGGLPPFLVDGRWVRVGDDEDAVCCVPSACTLFRTWRRAVSFVLCSRNLVPGVPVSAASSAAALGARFALPGLSWRPRVPFGVRRDLAFQFASLRSLASLRLPPLW